jgi:hypothetical protein
MLLAWNLEQMQIRLRRQQHGSIQPQGYVRASAQAARLAACSAVDYGSPRKNPSSK